MGDHTYSKIKLGYFITRNKHIPTKILTILIALLLVTTVFSSVTFASEEKDVGTYVEEVIEAMSDGQVGKFSGTLLDFINQKLENQKGLLSLRLVTKYQHNESSDPIEKSTRMRLVLPTSIDVNGDHFKDIRVWVIRRPALDFRPPAVCWKTTLLIRRLPGMMNIKDDFLEVGLEYKPRLFSLLDASVDRIRIGYQSPMGQEIPKTCIVTHKDIPHLLYPLKKTSHRVSINPLSILGKKQQLNLLFSVVDENDNGLSIQVNHSPAVINELSIDLSKDRFIRRGQTLTISRRIFGSSNVTVTVSDNSGSDKGYVMIGDVPRELSLSWFIGRNGYFEIDSHNSGVGPVKAAVKDVITLGFTPKSDLKTHFGWNIPGVIDRLRGDKSWALSFSTDADVDLSDLYISMPSFTLLGLLSPYKLDLNAALLSLDLNSSTSVGDLVLRPLGVGSISTHVKNLEAVLKDCTVNMKPIPEEPKPKISIIYPDGVSPLKGNVVVTGTAKAPEGKQIQYVEVKIDKGEWIKAEGKESWSYSWDTKTVSDGIHTINARCFDGYDYASVSIGVVVDNRGGYPTVTITSPSKLVLVDGVVTISGTADDTDDPKSALSVRLKIKGTETVLDVNDTTGYWSYDWNTTSLTAGLYTITAESYDGKDYSLVTASVKVWVRLKCSLYFNLSNAAVDVKNFGIYGESIGLDVSSFEASGSGVFTLSNSSISIDVEGSIDIENTTISVYNDSVTTKVLDNLSVDFDGYGMVLLSNPKIELDLAAYLHMHVDSILESAEITFTVNGTASAGVEFEEGVFKLDGGSSASGHVLLDITELLFNIKVQDYYLTLGADQIRVNGSGNVSVSDKCLTAVGYLHEFLLDHFYIHTDVGVVYLSGDFKFTKTASLTLDVFDASSFNLSSSGEGSIKIMCPEVEIRPKNGGSVGARATSIEIYSSGSGYASLSYYEDEFNVSCYVKIDNIVITDLFVWFNDTSLPIGNITGPFEFWFNLTGDINIEMGEDWIRITIGGRYRYVKASSGFKFNDKTGLVDVEFELLKNEDVIVINISNISGNAVVEVDGNVSVKKINKIYLYVQDIVEINVSEIVVSFGLHATAGKGNLILNLTDAERLLDMGYVYVNISNLFELTIEGSIASSHSGSGFLNITWNGTGLAGLDIESEGLVELNFTDFYLDMSSDSSFMMAEFAMFKITGDVELGFKDGFLGVSADFSGNDIKIITHLESQELYLSLEIGSLLIERGGLFTWEDKNLSFTSYSDTRFGLYDFSLDLIWEGSAIYLIMEESDIVFSGADITIDIDFSGDNITFSVDELTPYANVEINTLWANVGIAEIRFHDFVISVPMTVSLDLDGGQITFDLDEGIITAGEISVISLFGFALDLGLYGVDIQVFDDTSISLGTDETGGIVVDFSAAAEAHFENIIGPNSNIFNDIDFDFEGEGVLSINLNNWVLLDPVLHIEASVSENTTISFMPTGLLKYWLPIIGLITEEIAENYLFVIKLEPGEIIFNSDLKETLVIASTSLMTIGLKDPLFPLLDLNFSIELAGLIVVDASDIDPPYNNSVFNFADFKVAGWLKISRYIIRSGEVVDRYVILNGNGSGYLSWEKDENDKLHVAGYWDDGYLIFIKNVENIITGETEIVRLVLHGVDFDIKLGTGEGIVKLLKWLIFGGLGIWYMDEDGWVRIWPLIGSPPNPPSRGVVTLFAQNKETGPVGIIPGDDITFSALYIPANFSKWSNCYQQSQQQGSQSQPQGQPSQQPQQPLGGGNGGSEKLSFKLEYGDEESQTFEFNYSDEPMKVDLGEHQYTSLGTFNAKLTVSGDPDADADAVDITEIKSEAKYLGVSDSEFYWNYDEVSDDGKIYDSFEVKNKAHEIYSGGYELDWKIVENYTKDMKWGTNWTFNPDNGTLPPNSGQIVNFSFTPPVNKSDYTEDNDESYANITIIDKNNSQTKTVKFELEYGYIDLLPDSPITLYMSSGGTNKTFEHAFWVYTRYWEKQGLPWEVNYTYSNDHTNFNFTCDPDNGTKYRGELPDVNITVQPIKKDVYTGEIKVEKIGDPADNDTINIKLVVGASNIPIDITLFDYDGDWINKGEYFRVHVED